MNDILDTHEVRGQQTEMGILIAQVSQSILVLFKEPIS